jgi:hypothetical protein
MRGSLDKKCKHQKHDKYRTYNNYFLYGKNKDKLTPIQKHPLVFQPDLLDSLERLHLMVSIQMV